MTRPLFVEADVHPAIRDKIAGYQSDLLDTVRAAVKADDIVVVGMAQNPHVKKARALLKSRGLEFTYLEYGSYLGAWRQRLALKMWTGWPTFPMVFVKGTFVGGAADLTRLAESGELDELLGR
ncbi:MAG: glutaredoxin [Sandaracinaceae bacterium]|nr:glutaredoxin [Sandaracinaceae bacterium]